ncbi:MAG: hypothetical protein R3E04_10265 [Sphingobium sp.]
MSFGLALAIDCGLAFIADTRTSASIDEISVRRKMFTWHREGEWCVTLIIVGDPVVAEQTKKAADKILRRSSGRGRFSSLFEITELIGKSAAAAMEIENTAGCTMILGGQVNGEKPRLFQIYPQGNFIEATPEVESFAVGETKYSRALILTRYEPNLNKKEAVDLIVGAMEMTLRCNLSVGLPADIHFYETDSLTIGDERRLEDLDGFPSVLHALRPYRSSLPNPVLADRGQDFFDLLRELRSVTKKLSSYIRTINDRDVATADIRAARAYVDAFQEFLDIDGSNPPETIPVEIKNGVIESLKRIDWAKFSSEARQWAEWIMNIIPRLF